MKLTIRFFNLLLITIFFTLVCLFPFPGAAEEKQMDTGDPPPVVTEEQKTTFINIYSWATILPKELIDLKSKILKEKKTKPVEEQLPKLTEEIDAIRWDTTIAKTNPELQPMQVANLQERTQRMGARLNKITDPINKEIALLSENRKEWIKRKKNILSIDENNEIQFILEEEQYTKVTETVDEAIRLIEDNLKKALTTGKQIGDLQIILYSVDTDLQTLDAYLKATTVQQTAPSMLSGDFYSRINTRLFSQSFMRTKLFFADRLENMQQNIKYVFLVCFGFVLVCVAIYKTKDFTRPESKWQPFAKRPVATAIFMGSSINAITNIFPFNTDLPEQWQALLHVITLFAVIRLTKHLMVDQEKRKLLKKLSFFLAITMALFLLGLPQALILLYVFYVSIVAFIYYLSRLPSTKNKKISEVWQQRIWGIFPLIIIVSGVTGYDQLAVMFFSAFLSTIIACLIVWVLYLFHLGVLELGLSMLPFALINANFSDILKSVRPIIAWLHILILVTIQSVIWDVYPTTNTAFLEINNIGFDLGDVHISLKFIFTIGIVFYAALLSSKALQAFLMKNVLPRYNVEKGAQLSITRLAHYAILTVGFLIMLRFLGFKLNQITLLGGALGIGIGFGLQAIVTNFASGLILLFERPIKIGDTIQIGTEWGEVKQLGLRATIIQTFDNAEIVIPNSDLITGQVTNWTLADRKVRVKIPIGVAYGSDVSKVLEILVSCGNDNPMVLNTPKPNALFLAFGASSLDFELRVWIPEFLNNMQVLSDLNQDIDNEFALNNIEIPFPQSDLHLRSVDEGAGEQISERILSKIASYNK
ncbi:MAG: potassium efflux system protein [Desulforhopalus sp.]|jgi:potassium efflux system protein